MKSSASAYKLWRRVSLVKRKTQRNYSFILLCKSSYLSYQKHLSRKQKLPRQGGLTETSVHWCTTQMQPTNIERESIFLPFLLKTTKVVRHT